MPSILIPQLHLKGQHFIFTVPSSKSIANRVLVLAALTKGKFRIEGDMDAEDIQLMIEALKKLGIRIGRGEGSLVFDNDLSWRTSRKKLQLFVGNSGTCMRFLASLCALRNGVTILKGIPRMHERPIGDLVDSLRQLGVEIQYVEKKGFPPLRIIGTGRVKGGKVSVKGNVSSQYLSSLLLCSKAFDQKLELRITGKLISKPYLDLTQDLIKHWPPKNGVVEVEGDASAAVYWWALGFLHGVEVKVTNVDAKSKQPDAGFAKLLETLRDPLTPLQGGIKQVDMSAMPDASLMLMALAPVLPFPLKITGIGSLRVKETDRIEAMATELRKIGVKVKTGRRWMDLSPQPPLLPPRRTGGRRGGVVSIETYNDHRIAMSFAILGTKLGNLRIKKPECVRKTYPGFFDELKLVIASEAKQSQ